MLSFNCNRAAADSNPPQPPNVLSHFVDWVHTRKSSLGIIHERRDESIDLSLEGAVDISCAVELKAALVDALTSGTSPPTSCFGPPNGKPDLWALSSPSSGRCRHTFLPPSKKSVSIAFQFQHKQKDSSGHASNHSE
jgi:hypothetical protein